GKPQDFGALDRKALADAKLKVVFAETPAIVAGHAFTTGHIPVASFEKVLAPTRMTVGVKNGIGCFPDKLSADKRAVTVIPDDFVPMPCNGDVFIDKLRAEMPDKFIRSYTGSRFIFGA